METLNQRVRILWLILGLTWVLILGRYFEIQILKGNHYEAMSQNNKTRFVRIHPGRGLFISSDERVIGGRKVAYRLDLYGANQRAYHRLSDVLGSLLPERKGELERRERELKFHSPFVPLTLFRKLSLEELSILEARRYYYPEFFFQQSLYRDYPTRMLFSHALGYVGDPTPGDLEKDSELTFGDVIGKSGLEKVYDHRLRGTAGEWLVVVDAAEREVNRYLKRPDDSGENLMLTLSVSLQERAFSLMDGRAGSVVLLGADGRILVYLSSPSYDPNIFLAGLSQSQWDKLVSNPEKPLLDRNVQGLYPPGSLVKPFILAMALSAGAIDSRQVVNCPGGYRFGNHYYRCWNRAGHGGMDARRAIERSCDTYFYHLARGTNIDTLASWYRGCGFGQKTGIDLPYEASGLVPDESWSMEVRKTPWIPGETISVGIGQGPILVTPLQMAVLYAGLANDGKIPLPHFLKETRSGYRNMAFDPEALAVVKEALRGVVSSPKGTAHHLDGVPGIAGKTGTAQVMREVEGDPYIKEHSWFAGYAPADNPEIIACVIVENAGHGSEIAAPIAAELLRAAVEESR